VFLKRQETFDKCLSISGYFGHELDISMMIKEHYYRKMGNIRSIDLAKLVGTIAFPQEILLDFL
jgi:hypothetical protein